VNNKKYYPQFIFQIKIFRLTQFSKQPQALIFHEKIIYLKNITQSPALSYEDLIHSHKSFMSRMILHQNNIQKVQVLLEKAIRFLAHGEGVFRRIHKRKEKHFSSQLRGEKSCLVKNNFVCLSFYVPSEAKQI
jgi:hypothetical protein